MKPLPDSKQKEYLDKRNEINALIAAAKATQERIKGLLDKLSNKESVK